MSSRLPRDGALEKGDKIDEMGKKWRKKQQTMPTSSAPAASPLLPYANVVGRPVLKATQQHRLTKPPNLKLENYL